MTHGLTINTTSMLDPAAAAALQHTYGYAGNHTVSPTALHGEEVSRALQDARDFGPGSSSASSAFTSLLHTGRDNDSPVYDDDENLPFTSDIYDRSFQNERNAEKTDRDIMPEAYEHEHDSEGSDFEWVEADAALLVHSQKSEVVQGAEVEGEDEVAAKEAQGVSFGTQESGWQRRLDQTPGSFVKAIHPADVAKPEGLLA
ncbi:hypothetical protein L202_02516 [Cryptococcus amylolentus CBS 6039]|uniref:Uncharacterized protein n=1 Tax=Cryptococcus amylolentus CBS 6039 TaxID=1295533 RepID=A0A1E3I2Z6_9TREE|nr:hypothetical protein L202_02516 [Cryptococcus amylolentus CBS 6039]ODN82231.1 hypothetical protein L202_02516 [Cryptococcus amylolentus CBS 6039]